MRDRRSRAMTFDQIAVTMGITRERVRQIYEHALGKIRRSPSARVALREIGLEMDRRRSAYAIRSRPDREIRRLLEEVRRDHA